MPRQTARTGHGRRTWNSSPTPLLLSPRDMELAIVKERMRCDRHAQFFSLIVIQVNKTAEMSLHKQFRLLAKLLHKRLRLTDEKGLLLKGGLGVLLPMTPLTGARKVLDWAIAEANEHGMSIEGDVFSYSGKDNFKHGQDFTDQDSDSFFDDRQPQDDESKAPVLTAESPRNTDAVANVKTVRMVRADDRSQIRPNHFCKVSSTSTVATEHFCPRYPAWKRVTDVCGATIGLLIALPFIAVAGIAIKLTSKGPILFRQMRTGQYGNAFPIYKLRTMVVDAEELKGKLQELNERDGPAFKIKNDPRVTPVGQLLRKTGLDELPQLWNVLIGDMAIVGPRPLPCNEDAACEVWQRRRLDTKPGLTCVWQISKSRKVSFEDWMRMDLQYADRRSIRGDIALVAKTVMAVFLGRVGH